MHWFGLLQTFDLPGAAPLAQSGGSFWLPPPDSTMAESVDGLFYFLVYLSCFFFALIALLMALFLLLYRRREGVAPGESPRHNTPLEIIWSVIPVIIVVVVFYQGFTGYMDMRLPPREVYEIDVVARQWSWLFEYSNGWVDTELHVPAGQPVLLIMRSEDVIHSLSIPDFRVKMDLVPDRYTKTWFQAKEPGVHDLLCTEYCGTSHSDMITSVVVHKPGEFEQWLEESLAGLEGMDPAARGKRLFRQQGCEGCHTIDGTAKTGPSFMGIFGEVHSFSNAANQVVDEDYIRESILDPSAKIRAGYKDQMNSYKGTLTDEQINDLIKFIKSLGKKEQ